MFLDQIITKDSAHLMEYKKIKEQLQYKGGRMPRWYKFLRDHINNTGRLFCNLEKLLIQNPMATCLPIPPVTQDTHHHPKGSTKWVTAWVPHFFLNILLIKNVFVVYGKILSTTHFPNCILTHILNIGFITNVLANTHSVTPHSQPTTIIPLIMKIMAQ
ncbi:unnamed protein product [Rhizophagus irregularis]|nr:unnamed protein product [Rhizophagus irregularis]